MIFFKRLWIKTMQMNGWTLFFGTTTLILFSSYFIHYLEPETFTTPFDGLWWTMTTVVTVGYGDLSPVTMKGKIFAMFLYVMGIGLMTIFIGKFVDSLTLRKRLREEGKLKVSVKNHIILINWTKKTEIALNELLSTFQNIHVVIVDDALKKTPLLHERVEFVSGDPASEETLQKANILECKSVMIFSPSSHLKATEADGHTLLIASILEGVGKKYGKNIYTVCEISDSKHIQAFTNVNVEEFIMPNDMAAHLAARSILFNGTTNIIHQLTSNVGHDLYHVPKKTEWKTFGDAKRALDEKGAVLIANHHDMSIHQKLDEPIPEDAKLFIICDEKTYHSIS
ncbi:potassium channel family protein [Aeribacillus alveayuensis]|uniref:Voltage-gated potassium channel n=1 Tax=Aeribacillus alveayuensis TaxID=279215 RepID=A0ABT9VMG3_9BACI|nr:voltage-gated potassium channel [Bacillus alveayuensis]